MCISVLLACVSVHQAYAVRLESERQDWILWNWSCRQCEMYWESIAGPLEDQPVLLTAESSLQNLDFFILFYGSEFPLIRDNREKSINSQKLCFT